MRKIIMFVLIFFFVLYGKIDAQDANWNSWITIPPNPSPYISEWENNPNSITYSLQYFVDEDTYVYLDIGVVSEEYGEVFSGRSQRIDFNMGPELKEISSPDIIDWNSISWNDEIESRVVRTGRFPEGEYYACILAVSPENEPLTESCVNFSITYPDAPYLISPIDEDEITFDQPTFQWTPVLDYYTTDAITYKITIVEILSGQTAEQAILANPLHFENTGISTTLSYLPSAQSLEEGKYYAWQIQALDENDIPIANNDGKSEIWSFQYTSTLTPLEDISFVNDGLSDDEDFTNSKNTLSANWESVSGAKSYQYAIGTTEGGSDVVSWTESGLSANITASSLSLSDGKKYFFSVRAEHNDGSYGSVATSDGISVDTQPPTSKLEIELPPDKAFADYTDTSFKVNWSSSPSISPVVFDVQYKHENDLVWNTWLANTQLKFSTFSADVFNGDGKYYFRVQAKDLAGNLENLKGKPEDEIIVDTKPPTSNIKKLPDEQQNANFIVEWTGEDPKPGSEIEYYDVQVKEENGSWKDWLTKQTSTSSNYQGKEGKNYSFRSAATDMTGNKEQYPSTADAVTFVMGSPISGLYLSAIVSQDEVEYSHDDSWNNTFVPSTNYYHIDLQAVGSLNEGAVLDSVVFYWYTENLKLFKTDKKKLTEPISLSGGETKKVNLKALEPDPLPSSSSKKLVLILEIDYTGRDLNNKPIKAETQQLKSIHSLVEEDPKLALKVEASPTTISYAPGRLTNQVDVVLKLEGPFNTNVIIDKVIKHWYKKDKTKYATLTDQISPTITLKTYDSQTDKKLIIAIDQNTLDNLLDGKASAEYYVHFEYIGKDQNGNTVKGITFYPINVTYYSKLPDFSVLTLKSDLLDYDYYTSKAKLGIDLDFRWISYTSLILDSYYETLIDDSGKKTIFPTVSLTGNEIKINPGKETTDINSITNNIKGIPARDTSITKNLSLNIINALKGKTKAKYKLTITYIGKDGNGKKVTATSPEITLNIFANPDVDFTVNVTPSSHTFNSDNLQKNWEATLNFKGKVDVTIDQIYANWYSEDSDYRIKKNPDAELDPPIKFKAPSGTHKKSVPQTISDLGRFNMMKNSWGKTQFTTDKKIVSYGLKLEFEGKDALGREVSKESNMLKVILEEPTYPLSITATPEKLTTSKEFVDVSFTVKSNLNTPVTLDTRKIRIKLGTQIIPLKGYSNLSPMPGFKGSATDETIGFVPSITIPANQQYVDNTSISLNLNELLKDQNTVECVAEVEYEGKQSDGTVVKGKTYVPITVGKAKIVQEKDTLLTNKDDFVIIPKVAIVKAYKDLTTISKQGSNTILNGPVQLILVPDPFDSQKVAVEATNLLFSPKQGAKNSWEIKSGSFSEEGTALKKDLFSIYMDIMKINKISYDHSRTNRLLIDKAVAQIPILDKTIYFQDLLIDKDGLNLKIAKQSFTAYGFTFSVSDIQKKSAKSGDLMSLTAGIKLPVINKSLSNKEYSAQVVIIDNNGKKNIKINSLSNNPFQLIPGKNYLNFKSFKFVEKKDDNWVLEVEVTSDDLPLYKKLGLGPITTTFSYEKSGKMSGKLEPIKETKTGYDSNDISVIKIGKFGAIDLTYLGLKLAAVQKIATVDSKPDTTWEIDTDNSHFGIAADLHLPFAGKVLGDASGVINIGDYNKPGIKVDFNGKVSSETISVSTNKKLDLGPVFLKLIKFAITPDPFALAISGGFGIDMKDVFTGEIKIEGLKIDSDGKFTNFNQVVKGGNLSILKIIKFSIDNLEYESSSSKLSFTGGAENKNSTLQVDSYFRLKGANLSFGESGAAGGGFDELLIYEYQGNTNFLLENGKLNVKDVIDITIDIQYEKKPNEEYLSAGGSAKILKNYSGTLYGKIGERDGDATWGFYADVGGLKISLAGPLMLDNIGAGFFYRPLKKDISKVINLAGIKPTTVDKAFSYAKPKGGNDFKCAIFLKAGFIVSDKEVMDGIALTTITDSYFRVDANVKALDGKATGTALLNINWADGYAEGKFTFGVDFVVITAEEKDNYFQFYGYDKNNWGIMGKTDIKCFFLDTKSQFYVGSQGFLYDFGFGYSLDIGVLEGGLNYEIMAWWRKDVNWGIYAKGKIWGEFLWGLAGGKAVVEGALISPPFTIYVAGELTLTICYIDVFDGRVWIAMGEEGFDGGTGSNSKYDKLISDAKNIGQQMKDDMEKLAKELSKARDALYQLSEQQRIAAGKALMNLSAWSGGKGIGAFFGKAYKDWYNHDLHSRKYPYEQIQSADFADPNLKQAYNIIWNPQASTFLAIETSLRNDSVAISNAISQIENMETALDNMLSNQSDLMSGNLPKLSKLSKLKSPVTKPSLKSSTINGKPVQVFNFSLNTSDVNALNNEVTSQKKELEAYRNKLLSMVADYVKKIKDINQLLSGGSSSVATISQEYANTYDKITKYTRRFMDYLNARQKWGASQAVKITSLESKINGGLTAQANKLSIPSIKFNELCSQRIELINGLLKMVAAKNISPPKTDISATNYKDMGKELYYHIPQKGFSSVSNEMNSARQNFVKYFKTSNDIYQAKWNNFTVRCDKVYSRQTKLYTILYDLFDQLSLEAGTRKQGDASQQYLSVGSGDNLTYQVNQIATVTSTGAVSSNVGAQYANDFGVTDFSQIGQSSFQQVTNSGIIDANTGTNISQSQVNQNQVTKKADWAKSWDFEKERKYVKQILQVPKISQFSGNAVSDKNTYGYSILTLNWTGTHPVGISEYSISLDGYSDPVQFSDISTASTGDQTIIAEFLSDGLLNDLVYDNNTYGTLFQTADDQSDQTFSTADIPLSSLTNTSSTLNDFSTLGTGLQAWRTLGNKKQINIPFLNQVHDEGSYNIWIRARGAGGYTLERLSSINIDYCGTATSSSDFDWTKRESSLSSTDNTPPSTPSVYDGADTTSSLNQISASWSSIDYESGIQEYQYQVGYGMGAQFNNLTGWITAGGQTEMNIRLDQQMTPGTTYYIKVKAVNGAGMWSNEGISNGIKLKDSTLPTVPVINQILLSDTTLSANWTKSSDPESGIIGYLFSLGLSKESSDVINWCATEFPQLSLNKTQMKNILKEDIKKETTYYFSVKAMNGLGIVGDKTTKRVVIKGK